MATATKTKTKTTMYSILLPDDLFDRIRRNSRNRRMADFVRRAIENELALVEGDRQLSRLD